MFGKGRVAKASIMLLALPVTSTLMVSGVSAEGPVKLALGHINIDPIDTPAIGINGSMPAPTRYVTLMVGGDLGFGGSRQPVAARAGVRQGRRIANAELTRGLKPILKSDLIFANLETVVTSTNSLSPIDKAFNFRMHPDGVAHLVKTGFNVISTANNHAIDYGTRGMRHTLKHMADLEAKGLVAVHGVAATYAAMFEPALFKKNGASFAFSALGIGGASATSSSPGQVHYRSREGFDRMSRALGAAKADYRMMSVHYGQELQVRPNRQARQKLAGLAVERDRIDVVIGHHAHVPAGVQRIGERLVFYGLGNLLHLGMQNMRKFGICRDFGVMARLHLLSDASQGGRLVARAIEVYALDNMHTGSRVRRGKDGRLRIEVLNYLGGELSNLDPSRQGVRFHQRRDGSGLYCTPGAAYLKGRIGRLCKGWQRPSRPGAKLTRRLAHACRYRRKTIALAKAKLRGPKGVSRQKRRRKMRALARAAFKADN